MKFRDLPLCFIVISIITCEVYPESIMRVQCHERSVLHDSLHHLEHAFNVGLDLFELRFSETLGHGFIVDGALHPKSRIGYSRQKELNLLVKSGPSFW